MANIIKIGNMTASKMTLNELFRALAIAPDDKCLVFTPDDNAAECYGIGFVTNDNGERTLCVSNLRTKEGTMAETTQAAFRNEDYAKAAASNVAELFAGKGYRLCDDEQCVRVFFQKAPADWMFVEKKSARKAKRGKSA